MDFLTSDVLFDGGLKTINIKDQLLEDDPYYSDSICDDIGDIFKTDDMFMYLNNDDVDTSPLLSDNETGSAKWFAEESSDTLDFSSHPDQYDIENTNPNLLVDPQTAMPHFANRVNSQQLSHSTPRTLSEIKNDSSNTCLPSSANHSHSVKCQFNRVGDKSIVTFNDVSPVDQMSTKSTNTTPRHELNNPSRNNPVLLEQLQNPVRTVFNGISTSGLPNNVSSCSTQSSTKSTWTVTSKTNGHNMSSKVYPKPVFSYSCLIAMALKNSRSGSLPVSEIYNFMTTHFPYFKTAPAGWKNSVRHNLSLNKCFEKVDNPNISNNAKKGCLWGLNPAKIAKMAEEIAKWRKKDPESIQNSMSDPDKIDLIEQGKAGPPPSQENHSVNLSNGSHIFTISMKNNKANISASQNLGVVSMHRLSTAVSIKRENSLPKLVLCEKRPVKSCREEVIDSVKSILIKEEPHSPSRDIYSMGIKEEPISPISIKEEPMSPIDIEEPMDTLDHNFSAEEEDSYCKDLNMDDSIIASLCNIPPTIYMNMCSNPELPYSVDQSPMKQPFFHSLSASRTVSA